MKRTSKIISVLLALLFTASLVTVCFAAEPISVGSECNLTLKYIEEGVEFSLYRVADISADYKLTPAGAYADEKYAFSYELADTDSWRILAETLAAYTARDSIAPLQTKITDVNGIIVFDTVKTGLYLVIGERHMIESSRYTPKPTLITAPGKGVEDEWLYEYMFEPKYEVEDTIPETITRRVHKVWDDTNASVERPTEVQVELLRDGEIFDTVTLNSENGWSHQWDSLDNSYLWQITEKVIPAVYTVTIDREGVTFVVKNTFDEARVPPAPPTPDLPQTGMLWWPIPLLACGGLLLFCLGLFLKRRQSN